MTLVGSVAAGLAVALAVIASRRASPVERRLRAVAAARERRVDALVRRVDATASTRLACGAAAALAAAVAASVLSLGPQVVLVAGYAGYVAPAVAAERAEAGRRRAADRAVVTLVEWLHPLVACGRPVETAILGMSERPSGSTPLDLALSHVRRDYTLGVPMHEALAREGGVSRIEGLTRLADRLERARELGRGVLPLLADLRDELRAAERSRALERASHVEGKLALVLTLCYLPAFALLVIVPLFLTLLAGSFG